MPEHVFDSRGTHVEMPENSSFPLAKRGADGPESHACDFGGERGTHASLHPMARSGTVSATRSGGVLPREGGFISGGQADLCRLSGSHRVPQLRPSPRRAVRGVGRDERTRTATPEAHGVLRPMERCAAMS